MNRREFTRSLASFGLAPALPLQALGAGSATIAVASASADKMYFVSWYTARLNKTCSPDMLASELKMAPDVARAVFDKLVASNTVSAPNALGISRTVSPLSDSYARITQQASKQMIPKQAKAAKPKSPRLDAHEVTQEPLDIAEDITVKQDIAAEHEMPEMVSDEMPAKVIPDDTFEADQAASNEGLVDK